MHTFFGGQNIGCCESKVQIRAIYGLLRASLKMPDIKLLDGIIPPSEVFMTQNNRNPITTPKGGVFQDLAIRIKLILRLMGDSRVNPLAKILPIGALVYWIVPDLAP